LYNQVSTKIVTKQFINDFVLRSMIKSQFGIDVSPSFISSFKNKFRISSIKPSYSRLAAYNPHSEWIERQFLREVLFAFNTYDHDRIFNADETFCRTFPHSVTRVYGFTGTEKKVDRSKLMST
jgi:hypothetical protein